MMMTMMVYKTFVSSYDDDGGSDDGKTKIFLSSYFAPAAAFAVLLPPAPLLSPVIHKLSSLASSVVGFLLLFWSR